MKHTMDMIVLSLFLLSVGIISLSGVLMPGPVFAAAVVKGAENKHAGAWIALGHSMIEVPLIIAVILGLDFIIKEFWVRTIIGITGGSLLLYMGIRMFQMRNHEEIIKKAFPIHPFIAGIITTITNPYVFLWWATIGASLIIIAIGFGIIGIISFILIHESCDLIWDYSVSYMTFKSKKLWTEKTHKYIFGIFGIVLIIFGVYFIFAFWYG